MDRNTVEEDNNEMDEDHNMMDGYYNLRDEFYNMKDEYYNTGHVIRHDDRERKQNRQLRGKDWRTGAMVLAQAIHLWRIVEPFLTPPTAVGWKFVWRQEEPGGLY